MANVKIECKNYGASGREFIVNHSVVQPKRLISSLIVTATAAVVFKLYEMDATVLLGISAVLAVILILRLVNKVSKETLLVLPSVGVQMKTEYCLGHQTTQFFDWSRVKGIVIQEAIAMHSVICYLGVLLVRGATENVEQYAIPLFTQSWPQLKDLVPVYQSIQEMGPVFGATPEVSVSRKPESQPSAGDVDNLKSVGDVSNEKNIPVFTQKTTGVKKRARTSKS